MSGRFASHCCADVHTLGKRFRAVRAGSSATQLHDTEKQRVSESGVPVQVKSVLGASLFTARHSAVCLAFPQGFREWIDPPAAITIYTNQHTNARDSIQRGGQSVGRWIPTSRETR